MSPQFVELPPSVSPSGGALPSAGLPAANVSSPDQSPAVDTDMATWVSDARGWEELAQHNKNIVRVNAIQPSKADYETFGQAWEAIKNLCSESNPYIIELAAGVHYPFNPEGRGLSAFMQITVEHHPGGLVVRGDGPSTWVIFPSGLVGTGRESEVQVGGASLYIKNCWIGFSNGATSVFSSQINEFEEPQAEAFLPASSVCSARGSTFPDTSCLKGTPSAFYVYPGSPGEKTRLLVEDCTVCSNYDAIVVDGYFNTATQSLTTASEPRVLVAFISCRVYGQSNAVNALGINDGWTIQCPNASVLIRDCEFICDWIYRMIWTALGTDEGNRKYDPTKIWIESSRFKQRRSVGTSNTFGPASLLQLDVSVPSSWILVARDTVFEMSGEDINHTGDSSLTLFDGQTVTFNVCLFLARATEDGSSARLYLERCVVRHVLYDSDFSGYAATDKIGTFGAGFFGNPSGATAAIEVINTKMDIVGKPDELARFQRDIPCSPAGTIVVR